MTETVSFFSILVRNFLRYDFLIFLFGGATLYFYLRSKKLCDTLYRTMHLTVFVPENESVHIAQKDLAGIREYEVVALRRKEMNAYHIFMNFIMIFPLLGILGTVVSLLPLVSGLGQAQVQSNFFAALTSTLWGLVFAIVFKILDGLLSGGIEDNESSVALYLNRNNGNAISQEEHHVAKSSH